MHRIPTILTLTLAVTANVRSQQYVQLTDVPTIYIETEQRRSVTSKDNYIYCTLTYVDDGQVTRYDSTQIRGRGNSSWWNADKKPYRIKFHDKQRLLGDGFANARSWPLLANHGDKTMIRNALTYDLGRFMGMKFCPAARFVDLYLNGDYRGTYQISDQVQVHKHRVNISKTDGWLLEVANENSRESPFISTSVWQSWYAGIMYNIKNPDDEYYNDGVRRDIRQYMTAFEQAVRGSDFADPVRGYRAYVDEEDLVNWYVGAELTGNIDALYSIYMYKDGADDKLHFGPLWDLDIGYDNSSEKSLARQMEAYLWLWNRPYEQLMQRLWEDPWFAKACNDRLTALVDAGLQQYLISHIDSLRNTIWQTQEANFGKWRINQQIYSFERHLYHRTYDEYIDDLKRFVNTHVPYLQQAFAERLATAVQGVDADPRQGDDGPVYDLGGRPMGPNARKGIYIINHHKILRQ